MSLTGRWGAKNDILVGGAGNAIIVGGAGSIPAVAFAEQSDGTTLVTVGDPLAPVFEIPVREIFGTISQSDIVFSFLG